MFSKRSYAHYEKLAPEDTPVKRSARCWKPRISRAFLGAILCTLLLSAIIPTSYFYWSRQLPSPRRINAIVPTIPARPKVVGLVFYGRRSRVSILDCYLKRNLAENGGSLDQVQFLARTNNVEDLHWLDELVTTSNSYARVNLTENGQDASNVNYGKVWDVVKPGVLYVKIDDDVLFIDNTTIPRLIASKIDNPQHLAISANVVNNPALAWVHYHLGAVRPYLPETPSPPHLVEIPSQGPPSSWRASELPKWTGPPDFSLARHPSPPSQSHRWLPLGSEYNLDGTPITMTDWTDHRASWGNWAVVAQEHYSFLDNLERGELNKYYFDNWDYHYERLSINMIAVWGDDIVNNRPIPNDDERWLTVDLSKRLGRHVVVDGKAIVSHYAFRGQRGIESTDVLERYRLYAQEEVCGR